MGNYPYESMWESPHSPHVTLLLHTGGFSWLPVWGGTPAGGTLPSLATVSDRLLLCL